MAASILVIVLLGVCVHPAEASKNTHSRASLLTISGGGRFSEARSSRSLANGTGADVPSVAAASIAGENAASPGEKGLHKRRSELSRAAASARRSKDEAANSPKATDDEPQQTMESATALSPDLSQLLQSSMQLGGGDAMASIPPELIAQALTQTNSRPMAMRDGKIVASPQVESQLVVGKLYNVTTDMLYNGGAAGEYLLREGIKGRVESIDEEGDAMLDFGPPLGKKYVLSDDHSFLELVEDQPKENIECTSLTHIPRNVRSVYINLDRRTDRRKSFEANAQEFLEPLQRCNGWSVERLPAVDKEDVRKRNLPGVNDQAHLLGAIAAGESHLKALKKETEMQALWQSPVLVFEDDYRFGGTPQSVLQRMDQAFSQLNQTWDVVMFGDNSYSDATQTLGEAGAKIGRTKGAWCSEAYMVHPQYMTGLLDAAESGLQKMRNGSFYIHDSVEPQGAAFDTLWYPLQEDPKSKWIVFRPQVGQQANTWGDSDIR